MEYGNTQISELDSIEFETLELPRLSRELGIGLSTITKFVDEGKDEEAQDFISENRVLHNYINLKGFAEKACRGYEYDLQGIIQHYQDILTQENFGFGEE